LPWGRYRLQVKHATEVVWNTEKSKREERKGEIRCVEHSTEASAHQQVALFIDQVRTRGVRTTIGETMKGGIFEEHVWKSFSICILPSIRGRRRLAIEKTEKICVGWGSEQLTVDSG
jgi:hypothetical protein